MVPHIRSHKAPCSCFPKKVSLQLSSEQSVGNVRITQLNWKRVPKARCVCANVLVWPGGEIDRALDLRFRRSRVRSLAVPLSGNNLGQVVRIHVCLCHLAV